MYYMYTHIYRTGYIRNAENAVLSATFGRETISDVNMGHPYMSELRISWWIDKCFRTFIWWSDFRVKKSESLGGDKNIRVWRSKI